MFFGANQVPGRAKLTVIKGEGVDGVTYQLNGTDHVAGRTEGAILFPDDPLLSPRHANFTYKNAKLHVIDEASVNGVFMRIKTPTPLVSGALFLIGEQLLGRAVATRPGPAARRRGHVLLRQSEAPLEDEADPAPARRRDRNDLPLPRRDDLDRTRGQRRPASSTIPSSRAVARSP